MVGLFVYIARCMMALKGTYNSLPSTKTKREKCWMERPYLPREKYRYHDYGYTTPYGKRVGLIDTNVILCSKCVGSILWASYHEPGHC